MTSIWISRNNFIKLGLISIAAIAFSLCTRTPESNLPETVPEPPASAKKRVPPGKSHKEFTYWEPIEESGAEMSRLTVSPAIHFHIYPEAPIFTPDSRYFVYARQFTQDQPVSFWLCEVGTWSLYKLTDESPVHGAVISPDGDYFYYIWEKSPDSSVLVRRHLWSGEREEWIVADGVNNLYWLGTMTPDGRYYVSSFIDEHHMAHIIRFDLVERNWKIICSRNDIINAHPQLEPGKGDDLLIQQGAVWDEKLQAYNYATDKGSTLFLIDINGENFRPLPIGKPHTPNIWGHQVWLGKSGKVLATLAGERYFEGKRIGKRNYDIEIDGKKGNLITVSDKEDKPTVVAGGVFFNHIACSPDGRYYITDDMEGGIWIGSVKTGKYRRLCKSGTIYSADGYSHPHAFFSPDLNYAFFNSTATGIPHIYAATIPEEFLKSLDT
ncbi:MAG: hypothetical protein ABFS38_06185 [Bacteroidota bacterium]